jgi:hypothetical protein
MPLPLLVPIGLGLTALATGAYGAKKGYDAIKDNSEAKDLNEEALATYSSAQKFLNISREETNIKIESLGKLKVELYMDILKEYVDIFSKIKNIDFDSKLEKELGLGDLEFEDLLEIKNQVLKIEELAGGTIAALGSGALAGFGAFGGAGMLATASTGTAISSLSGVAATNATLAWFGGGSLAAGGLGMAGGMAVLGGIVTGPVLAVAGGIFAAKAEEAKNEAHINLSKSKALAQEMHTARVVVEGIKERVVEFIQILIPLTEIFENVMEDLEKIVKKNADYSSYKDEQKKLVLTSLSIATTLKNLCDAPIIDEDGKITRKSKRVLQKTREFASLLGEKLNG